MPCECNLRKQVNKFYDDRRFFDVVVQVGLQKRDFQCHRMVLASASEYFDRLFQTKVNTTCSDGPTPLHDISIEDFDEILKFAYTEKEPSLTNTNMKSLFLASDFLGMPLLTNHCINYISGHMSFIGNIFEMLALSCITNYKQLIETICDYIIKEFNTLSLSEEFLTTSFDVLTIVLNYYQLQSEKLFNSSHSLLFRNENLLLSSLIRWVMHSPKERANHFAEVSQIVDFSKISSNYLEFLTKSCEIDGVVDAVSLQEFLCGHLPSNDQISNNFLNTPPITCGSVSELRLHIYVAYTCTTDDNNSVLNIFSTSRYQSNWSCSARISPSPANRCRGPMNIVTLEDSPTHLYSAAYSNDHKLTFSVFTSSILDSGTKLASPPEVQDFEKFEMRGFYNSSIVAYYSRENYSVLHRYNSKLDVWFRLNIMRHDFTEACIVTDNSLLYLINHEYVLVYDSRTPKLSTFASTGKAYRYGAGTSLNGKIYALDSSDHVDVLDPKTGKWETVYQPMSNVNDSEYGIQKYMLTYEDKLWLACSTKYQLETHGNIVDLNTFRDYSQKYYIRVIDPRDRTWRQSELLNEIVISHTEYETAEEGDYIDSFCFPGKKYHGLLYANTDLEGFISFP